MKTKIKSRSKGQVLINSLSGMFLVISLFLSSCGSDTKEPANNEPAKSGADLLKEGADEDAKMIAEGKGVGPVKSVEIPAEIDAAIAEGGKALFESKCTACHKFSDEKYVGPGLKGVTKRRKAEWIMNMMMNPDVMTKQDPTAQELLATHLTQMTNQNVTQEDARKIYEYFRSMDNAK